MALLWVDLCLAHEMRPAVAEISLTTAGKTDQRRAEVAVRVNLEKLMAEIGPDHDDSDASPNRLRYDTLRSMGSDQLSVEFQQFRRTFIDAIEIHNQSARSISLKNIETIIPDTGDVAIPRDSIVLFDLELLPSDDQISWQWKRAFGEIIVRADDEETGNSFSTLLAAGQRSGGISAGAIIAVPLPDTIRNYIVVGFQHIIPKGLDHILFVVGLFLLTTRARALLLQVTVFTIAHTITLALGTLDIVRLPGSIVEPLIAASIVFVCVENLFHSKAGRWRLLVVFAFGLLHGLGFASVLAEVGLSTQHFFTALFAFNVGVELGQLCVIAGCYLLLGIWSRKAWYRQYISIPASVIVGLTGLFWFVQRVTG